MASDWKSRAKPVRLETEEAAAPKADWRSRAKPATPAPVEAAPVAAPAAPPEEPGLLDRLTDPSIVAENVDRTLTNMLEGGTFGAAGVVAPYLNAAVDEVNPFTESKDFRDRVKERQAQWKSKLDAGSTGAASLLPSMVLGPLSKAADVASNGLMSVRNADNEGKDLSDPDTLVDIGQTTALMSTAPHVVGEAFNTMKPMYQAVKPLAQSLRRGANSMASNAVGLTKAQLNNLPLDATQTIGQVLNDKGIIAASDSAETIAPKLAALRSAEGESMGEVLRTADNATGGSGKDIRAVSESRRAADAHERVKDGLRRRAMADRAGAAASMGRHQPNPETVGINPERPETFGLGPDDVKQILTKDYVGEFAPPMPPADPRKFTEGLGFDAHQFIDRAEKELLPGLSDPALSGLKAKTERLLKAYRSRAEKGMSFSEANKMKSVLQSTIRKFQDSKADQKVKVDLQRIIDDAIEGQLAPVVGDDNFKKFVKSKVDYGAAANATRANNQLIRKEAGNTKFGLLEGSLGGGVGGALGAGAAGLMGLPPSLGAAVGAAAGLPVAKVARTHGPAASAASMTGMANFVDALGQGGGVADRITSMTPAIVKALGPEKAAQFIQWLKAQGPGQNQGQD